MKNLLLAFLMLVSPVVLAQEPSFIEQVHQCADLAVGFTELATLAAPAKDSDQAAFMSYIQRLADATSDPNAKALIQKLGEMAWESRGHDPHDSGMALYAKCINSLGTQT